MVSDSNLGRLRQLARGSGMIDLASDGFDKVREGITTVEEVFHVAGDFRGPASPAVAVDVPEAAAVMATS